MLSGILFAQAGNWDIPIIACRSAQAILAHPSFRAAREAYVRAVLAIYEYDPSLSRLQLEAGRTALFIGIMCLHARYDPNDRATWPTLGRVTEKMAIHGAGSPRRVYDLVRRLISIGYLERRAVPEDRRTRILTPTPKMVARDWDFLVSHYQPLQMLFPRPGYQLIMERDPAFRLTQRRVSVDLLARGGRIMSGEPLLMPFLGRDAGAMILLKLMERVGPTGEATPLELSFSNIGSRIGVSRTHVRNLVREVEQQGLVRLTRGDAGQFIEAAPALVQAFDRFLAESMAGHDLIYRLALARRVETKRTGEIASCASECTDAARRAENPCGKIVFA